MCYVRKRKKSAAKKALLIIFLLIFAVVAIIIFINGKLDAIVSDISREQIRASVTQKLASIFSDYAFDGEYVTVEREGGTVRSVNTNAAALNALTARAASDVSSVIADTPEYDVSISLSNIFDDEVILGNVPITVRAKVLPTFSATADIRSETFSAGINQTHYKIYLLINVDITAVMLISTVKVHTEYEICITDMLIVGEVPYFYACGE